METLPAIRETRRCEDLLRGRERKDGPREFLGEVVVPEVSGEARPLIGLRGLDGIGDSAGKNETGSVVKSTGGSPDDGS